MSVVLLLIKRLTLQALFFCTIEETKNIYTPKKVLIQRNSENSDASVIAIYFIYSIAHLQ